MAPLFTSLASVITVIGRIIIVAQRWVWQVIVPILTTLFIIIVYLFMWYQLWRRCIWWWVWQWWFWVQVIWFMPFLFFEISVERVCGMFSVIGVTKYGCRVSGIFSVWIFSCSKPFLVSSSYFLIWLLYTFFSLALSPATSAPCLDASQSLLNLPPRAAQSFRSGRGNKDGVWFTRCVDGQEPKIHEPWTFAEDGTREVHPFARIKISTNFTRETFHTDFSV